jgi:hypothetical protein
LKQLRTWLDQNAYGQTVHLFYFGTFPPQAYGIHFENVDISQAMASPPPGLYVISADFVGVLPALGERDHSGGGQWLRSTPPTAIVGHSLYVYQIPPGFAGAQPK